MVWEDSANTLVAANVPELLTAFNRMGEVFDRDQYEAVRTYFGDPLRRDLDDDGLLHMIFTQRLNGSGAAAYVTSCDVPLLVPAFVEHMLGLLGDDDIAVMEIDGFTHPLSAVYRRSVLPQVESLLAQDRLRPVFLFDAVRTRRVSPDEMRVADPDLRTLRNLNTREDYEAALVVAGL